MQLIGSISPAGRLELLQFATAFNWDHCTPIDADDFWTQIHDKRAYFKIRPGGRIHLHSDSPPHDRKTHTVLATNPHCINRVGGVDFHCELGGIYLVDASIPHESFNFGDTDRIHLVETLR